MPVSKNTRSKNKKVSKIRIKEEKRLSLRDEIMNVDRKCATSLGVIHEQLKPVFSLSPDTVNYETIKSKVMLIASDLTYFNTTLKRIRKDIPDTLRRSSDSDKFLAIDITYKYNELANGISNVLMPNVNELLTLIEDSLKLTNGNIDRKYDVELANQELI